MKRIISVIIAIVVAISSLPSLCYADSSYKTRNDFLWGINSHQSHYNSYPEKYLEDQIYLIAKSGCNAIRIGGSISEDMSYLDNVVGLCNKYGLKIIMVFQPDTTMGLDYIEDSFEALATRYNGENGRGFVDIIQAWNETDVTLLRAKYGSGAAYGKSINDYFTISVDGAADLIEYTEYFAAAKKGLQNAGGKTKFMINFCYTHYGSLMWYIKENVKPDYIGWDWYETQSTLTEQQQLFEETCNSLYNDIIKDSNIPVIICETNANTTVLESKIKQGQTITLNDYQALIDTMNYSYTIDWIKGLVFYELLDEPSKNGPEGYYGLVNCELNGIIGEPKPIYNEIQRLLNGNNNLQKILKSDLDLSPYEALAVKTADDKGISTSDISEDKTVISDYDFDDTEDIEDIEDIEDLDLDENNDKTSTKHTLLKRITKKTPWLLTILVSVGILLLAGGFILFYIIKNKGVKKLK